MCFTCDRQQNSGIFCEPKQRRQCSNERSGASVETAEKAGERCGCEDCVYSTLHLPNGEEEETTVLQSIFVIFILLYLCLQENYRFPKS